MTDSIKHIGQLFTDFLNSPIYFNLASYTSQNQVQYFILDKVCNCLKLDTSAEWENHKKMHFESGLPICDEL